MPAVRDLGLAKRQNDRRAKFHTVATRQTWGRPRGTAFAEIASDNCQLQFLASFDETFAPDASVTAVSPFGLHNAQVIGHPPPGAGGRSSIAFDTEVFAAGPPLVQAQVPDVMFPPETAEIFLIGLNFRENPVDTFLPVLTGSTDALFFEDPFVVILVPPVFVPDPAAEDLEVLEGATVVKLTINVSGLHPLGPFLPEHFLYWRVTRS